MILSNQTGYILIPSTLVSNMTYVVPYRLRSGCVKCLDQQMTIAACVNDLSFLYEHVIGALDSFNMENIC